MSKTIFLKDSVLFISIDGKEYEVSNPEEVGENVDIGPGHDFILKYPLKTKCGSPFIHSTEQAEWPGGVELIEREVPTGGSGSTSYPIFETVARLLPKEKKEPESDYKQFKTVSSNTQSGGKFEIKSHYDIEPVESSEPQEEKHVHEFVGDPSEFRKCKWCGQMEGAAPVESQEELTGEKLSCEWINFKGTLAEFLNQFKITRLTP